MSGSRCWWLPWFVTILSRSGDAFVAESVGQDLLPKIFGGQESHGVPPGLYFLLFWVTFWPAATLAGMAAPAVWASRREKGARFLLAWLVPSWIVFELVMTKLPHYVLPLYPAIAILIAGILDSHRLARKNWMTWGAAWWFVLPVVMAIGMIVGLVMFGRQLGVLAWPFAAGALVLGLQAWRLFEADGAERSLLRAIAASILMSIALFGIVVPAYSALFPSLPLARYLRVAGCENPIAAAAGFHEPSLVYLAGTSTRLLDGTGAADFLRPGGCRFAFVEARHERSFLRRADAIGLRYAPRAAVRRIQHQHRTFGVDRDLPGGRRPMTRPEIAAWRAVARSRISAARWRLFFRPPRPPGRRPAWPPHGRLAIGALAAILIVAVAVMVLDARSVAGARALPAALVWPFRYITDLGLSGWFLFPTAFLLLAIAAADSPALPRFLAQCAGGHFGAARLCFHGDRRAGTVRGDHQAADRPRAAVRRRRGRLDLSAVRSGGPTMRASRPATPPRRSPRRSPSARSGRGCAL